MTVWLNTRTPEIRAGAADESCISSAESDGAEGAVKCTWGGAAFQHAPVKATPPGDTSTLTPRAQVHHRRPYLCKRELKRSTHSQHAHMQMGEGGDDDEEKEGEKKCLFIGCNGAEISAPGPRHPTGNSCSAKQFPLIKVGFTQKKESIN